MRKTILYLTLGLSMFFYSCQKQSHDEHNKHGSHPEGEANMKALSISAEPTNRKVISSQKIVKPIKQLQSSPVNAYGFISLDERRSNQVAARVSGRIEKLYVKYENQFVHKGEKILELYSPDLNTNQEELLYAHKVEPEGEITKHATHKLKLLGITDAQIKHIIESGEALFTLSIYSAYDGYIFYNPSSQISTSKNSMVSSSAGSKMGGGMGSGSQEKTASNPMSSSSDPIREGAYVSAGQTLFWINDLREVWGILSVDNLHQDEIALNDSVTVASELIRENPFNTVIRFIEPQYTSNQKFVQVRVYLPNPGKSLRINSLLEATISPKTKESLTLPASSILYLGGRQAVWKKINQTSDGAHVLEIMFVKLGPVSQGRVVVLGGLQADDEVALDAGYLMDRESLVKPE
ncbi:MAG: CzcABC family efflux RND transporter, membrane fusion protein [Cytophagales bacterium]|jgi:Cu(I)/Ag(I) efflux system membrane fusion protein|nr:efflux RND transporter periplasmic adaptor subunit [Bacteroidota bacterium]WHZ08046.1 MAG: CzcABC family efflux RND transporter, membrane fusion protein [Cytophagales bacterium]